MKSSYQKESEMMIKRIFASVVAAKAMSVPGLDNQDRYNQLLSVMEMGNSAFTADKFWAYGCNCQMAQPEPVRGKPVDELDAVCKRYKDCLKCVAIDHGEQCVNTFYKYKVREQKQGIVCKDDDSSCERALCECDKMFAQAHAQAQSSYDEQYHVFDGYFVPEDSCKGSGSNGGGDHKCCGADGAPKMLYNANGNKKCCADGSVKPDCGDSPSPTSGY